uniref:hypothetical protein n=1 Tax=Fusobacterium pseudoperiodonticum TaxID=2663009 RepID=UPI00269F9765
MVLIEEFSINAIFYERKKEVYKVKSLTEEKKDIITTLIEEYDIKTAEDIQEALKDLLGGTIKSMMEAEMDEHIM